MKSALFLTRLTAAALLFFLPTAAFPQEDVVTLETETLRYVIGSDGGNLHCIDPRTGADYCDREKGLLFLPRSRLGGRTSASRRSARTVTGCASSLAEAARRPCFAWRFTTDT